MRPCGIKLGTKLSPRIEFHLLVWIAVRPHLLVSDCCPRFASHCSLPSPSYVPTKTTQPASPGGIRPHTINLFRKVARKLNQSSSLAVSTRNILETSIHAKAREEPVRPKNKPASGRAEGASRCAQHSPQTEQWNDPDRSATDRRRISPPNLTGASSNRKETSSASELLRRETPDGKLPTRKYCRRAGLPRRRVPRRSLLPRRTNLGSFGFNCNSAAPP